MSPEPYDLHTDVNWTADDLERAATALDRVPALPPLGDPGEILMALPHGLGQAIGRAFHDAENADVQLRTMREQNDPELNFRWHELLFGLMNDVRAAIGEVPVPEDQVTDVVSRIEDVVWKFAVHAPES